MKNILSIVVLTLSITGMCFASAVTYAGSSGSMSAAVTFTLTGNMLDMDFTNTGTGAIVQMTFRGPALTFMAGPLGWAYANGMYDFSRSNAVNTLGSGDLLGGNEDFTFKVPAGFNLSMVGNPATNDGIRFDYARTTAYVEGYLQPTPEPASLLLLGSGILGVGAWIKRRARARTEVTAV